MNLHWYTCVFETWNVRLTNPFVRNISPCLYFWNTKNPSFPWELTSLPKGYFPQRKMFVGGWVTIYSEEQFLYTLFLLSHIIEPLYASCFLSHSHLKVSQTPPARRDPHILGQHTPADLICSYRFELYSFDISNWSSNWCIIEEPALKGDFLAILPSYYHSIQGWLMEMES